MDKTKRVFAFITGFFTALSASATIVASAESDSLKEAFAGRFLVGNILEPGETRTSSAVNLIKEHFNIITAENAMKPAYMAPAKGEYNFGAADTLVNWAIENDILVHGHTLVWHSQSAKWLTTDSDGKPLTRAEAKANMEEYINSVAGHFKGRIHSWDVVNEAFKTSVGTIPYNWMRELRTNESGNEGSPWFQAYENGADESKGETGGDYIYDAFVFARLADPGAILYYNDYNETQSGKREAIAFMVEELNVQWKSDPRNTEPDRLLIEGIGMQAHYFTEEANLVTNVETTIKRFARTGALVTISELDIPFGNWQSYKDRKEEPNEQELQLQADLYKELFEVFVEHQDSIERVSLWGKSDNQSWRSKGYPLIFSKGYEPKKAFYSILEVAANAPEIVETEAAEEAEGENAEKTDDAESEGTATAPTSEASATNFAANRTIVFAGGAVIVIGLAAAIIIGAKRKK